ncbi:MAG: asparagine synthase (glutamine-hydrolyzing) [Clostridiales bacterium]|jgi:asparagine synthase (glutamine-hydrolysing)|nr:asparagine synthase (glutamine-hydrolyzing) [Eubacteriales bacterium]MDH7567795.1 asparagine synthase (glutamine-hydrolyzing) [Clostridiales bacterium]
MCGIAGFWNKDSKLDLLEIIKKMTTTIVHRGPDDEGSWVDWNYGIALGHRRLSIIDLSPAGHQPMVSASGRYVITYNGEIYNFHTIRREVEEYCHAKGNGINLRGTSDTEVMLAAIEVFGLNDAVKRFVGMFAFALFDRKERKLYLVRDRLGEKPLYYGYVNSDFVFSSELKAICAYPGFKGNIDIDALALFFRHNYIPTPYSIYKGIYKLPPGTILCIDELNDHLPLPESYWSAHDVAEKGLTEQFSGNEEEALGYLESLVKTSVKDQMIADVPLGAFLSGGIDSSLIVSLMQTQSTNPVKTFTIGFNEKRYNEAEDAKKIAVHLGTNHTELYVSPEEAMKVICDLPTLYDEPFADSSQIPTFLVSKLARSRVTVSLSGDGGDELFGGYNRYFLTEDIWKKIGWLPAESREKVSRFVKHISPQKWDRLFNTFLTTVPSKYRVRLFGDKLYKLADLLSSKTYKEVNYRLISHWKEPEALVLGSSEPDAVLNKLNESFEQIDIKSFMMYLDLVTYLPDDILVKVDRAAMGVSLESRIPFLDHRVVEFAWKLPISMKIRDGKGKWPLRQILYKYVPKELIERPKMGFGVPIDDWLRGPLKEWAEELLSEKRLKEEGYLNYKLVREKWNEHLSGRFNWQYYLWDVLMFEAWFQNR